jgi:hypothetical protein
VIRSFGFQPFFEADAGGPAAGAAPAPASVAAPAPAATPDRVAQLERELTDARTKLTQRDQLDAESQRKQSEEQGNFKKLYEDAQAALSTAEHNRAAERAAEAAKAAQLTAARAAGIDDSLASRLVGDTPEALLLDAKALATRLVPNAPGIGATNPSATRGAATVEDQINGEWAKRKKGGFRF